MAAGGSAAAAAWQRRRLGVSSAFTCRLAYRSAYPGAYPYLSGVTYRICVDNHSCTKMFSLCLLCDSIPIRREIRIMFQLQAPPAFAYRSAGGSAAVGGSAAAAWQRRRFGVSSAFAYRSAYPGTYPCLSQVTDIISMEVPVSQLLAFQTHVTPQLLVLLPLSFSVIKCFVIFIIFSGICNKRVSLSHSLSELIGEQLHHAPFG